MKTVWLGQGGLLIISGKLKVVVDPYLSNSMRQVDKTMKRRLKIDKHFLKVKPDMIILTNSHPDHADMVTLKKYLHKTRKRTVVLASEKAYDKLYRERIAGRYSNIMFEEGDEWTLKHLLVKGVRCKTDDKSAFGVIIEDSYTGKNIYIAGNTLYNKYLVQELPKGLDSAYIPISGQYSTMNMDDAQRFARELEAKVVVPFHFGMFDRVDPRDFDCKNKIIPKPYKVIPVDAETPETLKLPAEERLKMGLDEKPAKYPKTYKEALRAEKAEEKAYLMRKKLIDALQQYVECDDPTMTDVSLNAPKIGTASMFPVESIADIDESLVPDTQEETIDSEMSIGAQID
ncbi:MAG: MBL fold metallo-hydrolase, partial [Clostridia bacterium]|nr:MBL fold metallo-hydrolase [Clostridia bacterium]